MNPKPELKAAVERFRKEVDKVDDAEIDRSELWGAFQVLFMDPTPKLLESIVIEWWDGANHYYGIIDGERSELRHDERFSYFHLYQAFVDVGAGILQKINLVRYNFELPLFTLDTLHGKVSGIEHEDNRFLLHTDGWQIDYSNVR
jgi:hypothetical protein